MQSYHKIETVFQRDMDGSKKLIPYQYRSPELEYLANSVWDWTEKIDGTNIRVFWDGYSIQFGGRTDKAQIPDYLLDTLKNIFNEEAEQIFDQMFGTKEVVIFGEGYGNKIQSVGKDYLPDSNNFIVFDVMINGNYQSRDTVKEIATAFGLDTVPIVGHGTIANAIRFVKDHPTSTIGSCEMEGLVIRPQIELQDRCGNRIICKVKYRDFKDLDI